MEKLNLNKKVLDIKQHVFIILVLRNHVRLERQGMKNQFEQRTSYSRKLVTKRMIVTPSKIMNVT